MSPAEQLRLTAKSRVKAERCLANAVYFESRSEPVRGQIAVAQVVLNRAFSGYYPNDVCGVVYQGANRHLSCQFTFACDGIPDVVTDAESWERAKRISRAALDGKLWLNEIGKATHYHALYVNPYWVRSMRRLHRIGLHSFYRPRQWGSGADAPSWGNPLVAEVVAKL
jgi:spore germination cell wall hydrolase CwlJ-like protein